MFRVLIRLDTDSSVTGFAKYEAIAVREIQADTPAVRRHAGRLESTVEILRCCYALDT